jgi:hypothetical protein
MSERPAIPRGHNGLLAARGDRAQRLVESSRAHARQRQADRDRGERADYLRLVPTATAPKRAARRLVRELDLVLPGIGILLLIDVLRWMGVI